MRQRKQSTTTYPIPFFMSDSSDHMTGKTGLSPTVTLSKNGAEFSDAEGTVSETGNGWYLLAANANDRDTLGSLVIHAEASGSDPFDFDYYIVAYDPFTITGSSTLDVTVTCSDEPVEGITVEVYTSASKIGFVGKTRTTSAGLAHFDIDPGTYYVWILHSDYEATNPTTVTVT